MVEPSYRRPDDGPEVFRIDDDDRYASLKLIPWWRQDRLKASRVLVVGAGALGNEVVKNLALVGVGTIVVVDMDAIEPSNLSRSVLFRASDGGKPKAEVACARGAEINPDVRFVPVVGDVILDVGLGAFLDADVVIGCLDNREARLWVNRQCWKANTPWVDSGIQEIQGVVKVFVPPDSPCYECAMTERDYQLLNVRYSCPMLRRDEILEGKVPTAPTIASMMAALEVQEALKLIHGLPVDAGSALVFNGVANNFYKTRLPRRDECLSHETYPEAAPISLDHRSAATELFELARGSVGGPMALALDRDLVASLDCPRCSARSDVFRPRQRVSMAEAACPTCGELRRPEVVSAVDEASSWADRPLGDLGIPPGDVVRVDGAEGSAFFRLAGGPGGGGS